MAKPGKFNVPRRRQMASDRPMDTAVVDHPRLAGYTETVRRVTDTLSAMFKRKQLTKTEYQAGVRIQEAFDTLTAGPGGAMDFDRVRGGSAPGSPPSPPQIDASQLLDRVRSTLYAQDWAVVLRICGQGMSIEETTENLYGKPTTRAQRDDCGRRLKEGLRQMADRWFPRERSEQGGGMRFSRSERPTVTDAPTAAPGGVAHATTDRVYRS